MRLLRGEHAVVVVCRCRRTHVLQLCPVTCRLCTPDPQPRRCQPITAADVLMLDVADAAVTSLAAAAAAAAAVLGAP